VVCIAVLAALAVACVFAGSASAKTVWLCKPGMANNPCTPSLTTTEFSPTGKKLGVDHPKVVKHPKFDCFYVYPTVSDQPGLNANLNIDPQESSIALYQAARYSQLCRVYAPMYRQATIGGIGNPQQIATGFANAYVDVLAAWKDYLRHFNKGRPFVLVGHSQGSFHLRKLIAEQIDNKPALRKRLISAILLGGNVTVKKGKDVGGDFKHVPACRSETQLGCVIAFSTFNQVPPADSKFGRTTTKGQQVLCTNPASLHGGSGLITPIEPTAPFAPGSSINAGIALLQLPLPTAPTPFIALPGAYRAHCSTAAGANVLQIAPHAGAPVAKPSPDPTWGLHLVDANIALGNLLQIVSSEARAYGVAG
jgi:hypothetical protein